MTEAVLPRTLVMGVLNVTPDSFSDGGRYTAVEAALGHARLMREQGADIIDIGGESTRPGAALVPREEELRRVLPVVRALTAENFVVSVDTLHAETAQAVVAAGARYINDVSGGLHDPAMLEAAAWASGEHGATFIIGHWRGIPDPAHVRSDYADVVVEVRDALAGLAAEAIAAGVAPEHIVIDPGLGFDKTGAQGWELLRRLDELAASGFPVLIGASRKRMLAEVLGDLRGHAVPPAERDLATAMVSGLVSQAGAWGVRVHDVDATAQAIAIANALGQPGVGGARGTGGPGAAAAPVAARAARSLEESRSPAPESLPVRTRQTSDRIRLTGLEVFAHHGVFDFERAQGQRFLIDAEVAVDLAPAAAGDALAETVHYGELADALVAATRRDPVDLIETLAERLADVALSFAAVETAEITVHKPDAPIDAVFGDVSVSVRRRRDARRPKTSRPTELGGIMIARITPVLIAFGANLGDRGETIREAQQQLAATDGVSNLRVSPLRETIALTLDGPDLEAPHYINGVALADTTLAPDELLDVMQAIETSHGRTRDTRWGDRTLDIDLILFGGRAISDARLSVPHPRAHERDFVLAPWLDLDPDAVLMGHGRVVDLLQRIGDTTRRFSEGPDAQA